MPHLTIEYTNNLLQFNASEVLLALNKALVASGQFEEIDIKSRTIEISTFLVGTSSEDRGFVHVKLAILNGRTIQIKHEIAESLLHVLKEMYELSTETNVQLCVEVQEIERETYLKSFVGK